METRSLAGDTVSKILLRELRETNDDLINATYDLNPGLQRYGLLLPGGLNIILPQLLPPQPNAVINIWD